jgi:hypothetical protein
MKRNVIITASDKKYGNFLINHWLKSLKENVNLENIDIFVIDYGLSDSQKHFLESQGVKLYRGTRNGHVVIIRFRDIKNILVENNYKQVLICDGGDIIFQSDISHLFLENVDKYRAVCEDNKSAFNLFLTDEFFSKENKKSLLRCFLKNKTINAGFILAPRLKMIYLCEKVLDMIKNKNKFGPDQLVVNFVLYKDNFHELDNKYNFVIPTASEGIVVHDGVFYLKTKEKIPVVHNAGNMNFLRLIDDFGYGKKFNILKRKRYLCFKKFYQSTNNFYKSQKEFMESREKIKLFVNTLMTRLENTFFI